MLKMVLFSLRKLVHNSRSARSWQKASSSARRLTRSWKFQLLFPPKSPQLCLCQPLSEQQSVFECRAKNRGGDVMALVCGPLSATFDPSFCGWNLTPANRLSWSPKRARPRGCCSAASRLSLLFSQRGVKTTSNRISLKGRNGGKKEFQWRWEETSHVVDFKLFVFVTFQSFYYWRFRFFNIFLFYIFSFEKRWSNLSFSSRVSLTSLTSWSLINCFTFQNVSDAENL